MTPPSNILDFLISQLGKYKDALEVLVLKQKNMDAALRFCAWCTDIEIRQKLSEESSIWRDNQETSKVGRKPPRVGIQKPSNAYTVLLRLLLTRFVSI